MSLQDASDLSTSAPSRGIHNDIHQYLKNVWCALIAGESELGSLVSRQAGRVIIIHRICPPRPLDRPRQKVFE
jgi:hypothetical protein